MSQKIKGAFFSGGLAVLLYLSGLLLWLTPLALLYAYKKKGREVALWGLVCGLILLGGLYFGLIPWVSAKFGVVKAQQYLFWLPGVGVTQGQAMLPGAFGLPYFIFYAGMGLMLGHWEEKVQDITVLVGRVVGALVLGAFLWVLWQSGGSLSTLVGGTENYFQDLLNQMLEAPPEGAPEIQDQLAVLHTYGPSIVYYAVRLIPGMILAMAIFVTWLNIVIARRLFFKDAFFKSLGSLKKWQLPFSFVWALIGTAALMIADIYLIKVDYFKLLALNAFIVFGSIYFFQGLAILAFYSQRWSIAPLLRLVFYLLFFLFFQPVGFILLGIGFFDSWFDFRKLTPKAV